MVMKKMKVSVGLAIAAVLTTSSTGLAQYAIGDGSGLDANIQRGPGGVNPTSAPNPYGSTGNDLVTGNVSGGRHFRGQVNYGGTGDFRGRTGSDSLYDFQRSAAPQMPGQMVPQPYYRESRGIDAGTAGSTPQAELLQRNRLGVLDGESRGDRSGYDPSMYQPASRLGQDRIGVVEQPGGRSLEVSASPLIGVQTRSIGRAAGQGMSPDRRTEQGLQQSAWEQQGSRSANQQQIIMPNEAADPTLQLPSSGTFDNQIQPQMRSAIEPSIRDRMTDIEARQRGPEGGLEVPVGEDAVLRVLRDRSDRQRALRGETLPVDPANDPDNRLVPAPVPTMPGMAPTASPTDLLLPAMPLLPAEASQPLELPIRRDDGSDPMGDTTEAADAQPAAASDDILNHPEVIEAMRRSRGLSPTATPSAEPNQPAATTPAAGSRSSAAPRATMVEALTYDRDAAISERLRQAENDLGSGRYFDAEQKYRLILLSQPELSVARVGLIHAQLGAGLIRTASHNLKALLERHPEFVATRYHARLLPSPQRLTWVREQLEQLVAQGDKERPGIMIAYLGYQTQQPKLVEYGLGLAREAKPGDPLVQTLNASWGIEQQ